MKLSEVQWKRVNKSDYLVSNTGMVKDIDGNILDVKPTTRKCFAKGCPIPVHKMVAEAFIENPLNLPNVIHLDGVQSNNRVDNLKWATKEETAKHMKEARKVYGFVWKQSKIPVMARNRLDGTEVRFESIKEASRRLGLHKRVIQDNLKYGEIGSANWEFLKCM